MSFLERDIVHLAGTMLTKQAPAYVQYYITARCNLRCQQCNVIYANSDLLESNKELSLSAIDNLGKIGTSVLLFTGGEPFLRKDLPELVGHALKNQIHPRIQTNGLATIAQLEDCVAKGVKDISISLDSLDGENQDFLNGQFTNSFELALQTISNVTQVFPKDSFCALGCVFSPFNFREVTKVLRFATSIGWNLSLVPAHYTTIEHPRSFSTFDPRMKFETKDLPEALDTIDEIISMKNSGYLVYDSLEFLNNMKLFIAGEELTWRDRNDGLCDASSLYFAVLPDTSVAVCCDYRLSNKRILASDPQFINYYRRGFRRDSLPIVSSCNGCLYGSYPEISISSRFFRAALENFGILGRQKKSN